MAGEVASRSKRLYKAVLVSLKLIPMLLALFDIANTVLGFLGIECHWISYFGGVSFLTLAFLYLASHVFGTYHLASGIADSLGIDLSGEIPAYLAGDAARELADVICRLGCSGNRSS